MLVKLTSDEALVLFEWLTRTSEAGGPASIEDPAERIVLATLLATLEEVLAEPFAAEYTELLDAARQRVRNG